MAGYKTKIKICGLSRPEDIRYVNEAKPDFCGFIIDVPFSRRNVSPDRVRKLRENLDAAVSPVGVFVNADPALPAKLANAGVIDTIQLHGQEDEVYIRRLRELTDVRIMKAFSIKETADLNRALASSADWILLDNGKGGTGAVFDWRMLENLSADTAAAMTASAGSAATEDVFAGSAAAGFASASVGRESVAFPAAGNSAAAAASASETAAAHTGMSGVRPWFLAGGIGIGNIAEAIERFHPWAVDMSSSVETDGKKDREKILAAVNAVRAAAG